MFDRAFSRPQASRGELALDDWQARADGDHSQSVRDALRDLETQAKTERAAIQTLKDQASTPIVLPTPERVLRRAQDLDKVLSGAPLRAREALRRVFEGGRIVLHPQADGTYLAEGTFLPLVALAEMTQPLGKEGARGTTVSCAGAIWSLEHAVFVDFEAVLVA